MTQLQRRLAKTIAILLLLCGLIASQRIPLVAGAGTLYLNPGSVAPLPVGSTFSVQVKVSGMDQFNGWEIQIVSDPSVISPTSISTAGNIFAANTTGGIAFPIRNCVNGSGTGCCLPPTSCTPLDGPGIADSAIGYTKPTSGSGLLLNVTFQVASSKPYSPIIIQTDQISNLVGGFIVHTTSSGYYGSIVADLAITPPSTTLGVVVGYSNTTTFNVTSLYHFSGLVNLTATPDKKGITATLSPNQTMLSDGQTAVINLIVQARANASATSYAITLKANSTKLILRYPHTKDARVSVHQPDFIVYATPSLLLTHQASSSSTTITVQSKYFFTGTVDLSIAGPTPFRIDRSSLTVQNGGINTTTLTISTQSSPTAFEDDFNVNATSGSIVHKYVALVVVIPPPGDFGISTNADYATVLPGNREVVSIGVASLDYFSGAVFVLGTSKSGLGLSFDPANIYLDIGQSVTFKLTVTTDTSTAPGYHTVDLTVYGQLIGKAGEGLAPTKHTTTLTFIVTQPLQNAAPIPTFVGLQEQVFYGMIGGIALVLAVLGFFEARRPNRPKVRSILQG